MATQSCPNCQRVHDVAVYVTGQRVLCSCGIKFEVRRTDVSFVAGSGGQTLNQRPARPPEAEVEVTYRPPSKLSGGAGISVHLDAPPPVGEAAPPRNELAGPGVAAAQDSAPTFAALPQVEIPGFELLELLGRGGMGEVWRAHQKSLGRTVAVKLLPDELARDVEFVARFEKEATALASLSHPHIIQIIDRGSTANHYYFVMEFVDGRSLREVISARRPTPQESLRLILQILRAMEAAHEKGIIHRDLKPENILVDARGHVKVADFGLAGMRAGEERLQLTATAVAMGTINYMAPEQRRDARNVDQRADLFSVGVILYELLTGDLPVGRFRLPSERDPSIDPRFDPVVGRLLDTDPTQRFTTATEVIAALEPLQTSSGVSTFSLGPPAQGAQVPSQAPTMAHPSFVEKGFRGLRTGLMVIGALAVIGFGARLVLGRSAPKVTIESNGKQVVIGPAGASGEAAAPGPKKLEYTQNSDAEVFSAVTISKDEEGRTSLALSFEDGDEEINVHAGEWNLAHGALTSVQAGSQTQDGGKLVPRAYLAKRYFSSDDFDVEAEVSYHDISSRYEIPKNVTQFAEVAFRIKDVQVSAFAIPGVGMRLGWRYFTPDGMEVAGNSARDLRMMVEDEMPAPNDGTPFRLRLQLKRVKNAVQVIASMNGHPFAKKVLPGLQGQIGKVALGCRNYQCEFRKLTVVGKAVPKPVRGVSNK